MNEISFKKAMIVQPRPGLGCERKGFIPQYRKLTGGYSHLATPWHKNDLFYHADNGDNDDFVKWRNISNRNIYPCPITK